MKNSAHSFSKFKVLQYILGESVCPALFVRTSNCPTMVNRPATVFKMTNAPRLTKIGRFLCKTSRDELPQLFNVLFGEMAPVGVCPPLPERVFPRELKHRRRTCGQPGKIRLYADVHRLFHSQATYIYLAMDFWYLYPCLFQQISGGTILRRI